MASPSRRCMTSTERGMSKKEDKTCESCDNCVYVGEGDFACDEKDYEIVIEGWVPLRKPCKKWVEQ